MNTPFDTLAREYDRTRGLLPDEAAETIANTILALTSGAETRFLEPGIGTGRLALPLIKRDCIYTGIDISMNMLAELTRKVQGIDSRLNLIIADVTAMPFESASFDAVLTSQVLYLVPGWREALAEIRRVLTPSGIYLFCHEETERNSLADLIDRHWFDLIAQHVHVAQWQTRVSDADILGAIQEQSGIIHTVRGAEWEHKVIARDYLERFATKVRSLYSQVPDHIFASLVHQLYSWTTTQANIDLDVISTRTKFVIDVVNSWSANQQV